MSAIPSSVSDAKTSARAHAAHLAAMDYKSMRFALDGGRYRDFEQAANGLAKLAKDRIASSAAERIENPMAVVDDLIRLMESPKLEQAEESTKLALACALHLYLDLMLVDNYERADAHQLRIQAPTKQRYLAAVDAFRGLCLPDAWHIKYELDCCYANIKTMDEGHSLWSDLKSVLILAVKQDIGGLLTLAAELHGRMNKAWQVDVLLIRRLTPLAQQSPQILGVLQGLLTEWRYSTDYQRIYAGQEALHEVVLYSQEPLRSQLIPQVFGVGGSLEVEQKRVTFQYFEGRHAHPLPLRYKLYKPTDPMRYRFIQALRELSQGMGNTPLDKRYQQQAYTMLCYLACREPGSLANARRWISEALQALSSTFSEAGLRERLRAEAERQAQANVAEQKQALEAQLQEEKQAREKLTQEKSKLDISVAALAAEKSHWEEEKSALIKEKQGLEAKTSQLSESLAELQGSLEVTQGSLKRLQKKFRDSEAEQKELETELQKAHLKGGVGSAAVISALQEELEQSQKQGIELKGSAQNLERQLHEKTNALKEQESQLSAARMALVAEQEAFCRRQGEAEQALQARQEALDKQAVALKEFEQQLKEKEEQLIADRATLEQSKEELDAHRAEFLALAQAQVDEFKEALSGKSKALSSPSTAKSPVIRPWPRSGDSEAFREAAQNLVLKSSYMCPVLKRPAYDMVVLKLEADGYEEEQTLSDEAARAWLIDEGKTTCPVTRLPVKGVAIPRAIREDIREKIQELLDKAKAQVRQPLQSPSSLGLSDAAQRREALRQKEAEIEAQELAEKERELAERQACLEGQRKGKRERPGISAILIPEVKEPPLNAVSLRSTPSLPVSGGASAASIAVAKEVKNSKEVLELLMYVTQGEQDKAEVLLRSKPGLALQKGTVTDLSQREFKGVTGFQYAVWALDWHMWRMLLKYLPKAEARAQLREWQSQVVYPHDKHVSWQGLIEAYTSYMPLARAALDAHSRDEASTMAAASRHWIKRVGGAQLLLPAHVANEYCHESRPFHPLPNFRSEVAELTRSRLSGGVDWYDARCGTEWAHYRNSSDVAEHDEDDLQTGSAAQDRPAVSALWRIRLKQRADLMKTLAAASSPSDSLSSDKSSSFASPISFLSPASGMLSSLQQRDQVSVSSQLAEEMKQEEEKALPAVKLKMKSAVAPPSRPASARPEAPVSAASLSGGSLSLLLPSSLALASAPSIAVAQELKAQAADAKELSEFLRCIAYGEQIEAETMLKARPGLALKKGDLRDPSGREFKEITGFQYAVWGLDWHMWRMLLTYMDREAAALQFAELEEKGTAYGKHFSLVPLIEALNTYVKNYAGWNADQCRSHWCRQVGGSQLLLPVHVAQEYCHPSRTFSTCPEFKEEERNESLITDVGEWYGSTYNGGRLGEKFGYVRGGCGRAFCVDYINNGNQNPIYNTKKDVVALQSLSRIRQLQLEGLKEELRKHATPTPQAR